MEETEKGSGWVLFAAIMLVIAGFFNTFWGIGALAKADALYDATRLLFGNLTFWGWTWLIVGVLEVFAGFGVLSKSQWARWFGIVMASISALTAFFYIWAVPTWVLIIILLDVLVIYGLAEYGARDTAAS
jgi:hypothetical protein